MPGYLPLLLCKILPDFPPINITPPTIPQINPMEQARNFTLLDTLCMLFIYAFIGWVVEVIYYGVTEGKFINRGFLNGPLCPVYGFGFYGVIMLLLPLQHNYFILFFGSSIICTTVELIAGVLLYRIFELRWWDYTDYKLNFKGFICVRFALYWGLACSLGINVLHPTVLFILTKCPDWIQIVLLSIFFLVFAVDLVATVISLIGFKKNVSAILTVSSKIHVVSDLIGSGIYEGVETVAEVATPVGDTYEEWRKMVNEHNKEEQELAKKNRAEERALLAELVKTEKETFSRGVEVVKKKTISAGKKTAKVSKKAIHGTRRMARYYFRILGRFAESSRYKYLTVYMKLKDLIDTDDEDLEKKISVAASNNEEKNNENNGSV